VAIRTSSCKKIIDTEKKFKSKREIKGKSMTTCKVCGKRTAEYQKYMPTLGRSVPVCAMCVMSVNMPTANSAQALMRQHSQINRPQSIFVQPTSLSDILDLSSLLQSTRQPAQRLVCPNCATEWAQVKRGGKLGCSECYVAFATPLASVIQQIYGG